MKVNDLIDKEFENINLKKIEARARLKFYNRKIKSLIHQIDVISIKSKEIREKLVNDHIAYPIWDIKYDYKLTHIALGGNYYVSDTPENQKYKKIFNNFHVRTAYLSNQIKIIKREMKGTRSAVTRLVRIGKYRI